MNTKTEVLEHIKAQVLANNPQYTEVGICRGLTIASAYLNNPNVAILDEWAYERAQKWPRYSGNEMYPVLLTNSARQDYLQAHANHDMWSGEYGKNRMELLDFLIEESKK